MTLKSLNTKLYLGMAVAGLAAWAIGVPGRTVLTVAAVGFMIAMHAGGHHRHGRSAPGGHGDRDSADSPRPGLGRGDGPSSSNEAVGQDPAGRTRPDSVARGCH